jgi:hypothetical protein
MEKATQQKKILIGLMIAVIVISAIVLLYTGYSYYSTSISQRYFNPSYNSLKPSGTVGHGLGIIGSLFIVTGVFAYMARKRIKKFSRVGLLSNWLVFHIFLCTLGPVLILFHTSFKFDGIIAIGFWCMLAVMISGVVGRFIYQQIPRTIEGRTLSLKELEKMAHETKENLQNAYQLKPSFLQLIEQQSSVEYKEGIRYWPANRQKERLFYKQLCTEISLQNIKKDESKKIKQLVKSNIILCRRIRRLETMHRHFRNWHVIHLPFALVMLVIMIIHVAVALYFGYYWIF